MSIKNFPIRYFPYLFLFLLYSMLYLLHLPLRADVPYPVIHKPPVPYHMQYINFQTVELDIFGDYISGMIADPYADLAWNPAFIINQAQTSVYLKLNFNSTSVPSSYYIDPDYTDNRTVLPRWYRTSSIYTLNTEPVYHIAFLKKISSNVSLGIVNRSILDYGPYRSTTWWDQRGWDEDGIVSENNPDLDPQTLEVDNNKQQVLGNHMEIFLGYKITEAFSAGFKLGHYLFRREGSLYDSKWGHYPHYSYGDLNDGVLDIKGDQYEIGAGVLYKFNENTRLGVYGSYLSGSSTDTRSVQDTSDYWSENAADTKYYNLSKYDLFRNENYSSDDSQPLFSLVFEKKFSSNITLRSFLKSYWLNTDLSGKITSSDTTYADRTYDTYHDNFRRHVYHHKSNDNLSGNGKNNTNTLQWFTSLSYEPDGEWSFFSGVYFSRTVLSREIIENSDYFNRYYSEYSEYDPETRKTLYSHTKKYSYDLQSERWKCIIPVGFRTTIVKGFDLILGAHLSFTGSDSQEKGSVLYVQKLDKRWKDGVLTVSDVEFDRRELYSSDPPFSLQRETDIHLGAMYEHSSGLRIFLRTEGDFSDTDYWALGFEMEF